MHFGLSPRPVLEHIYGNDVCEGRCLDGILTPRNQVSFRERTSAGRGEETRKQVLEDSLAVKIFLHSFKLTTSGRKISIDLSNEGSSEGIQLKACSS